MLFYMFMISLTVFIFVALLKFETPINFGIAIVATICGIALYSLNLAGKVSDITLIVGTITNVAISSIIILNGE